MFSLKAEKARVKQSFFIPLAFVAFLWLIKIVETMAGLSFSKLGVYPREIEGMIGIVLSPFIHGSFTHLFSNSWPLVMLGFIIMHSYRKISYELIFWIFLISGIGTWVIGRPSHHIGASGVVYGFAFFIFFSGVFRKDIKSMALALLVVFLYGGMVWGLLPIKEGMSFEGHIAGAFAGVVCAYYFRGINAPPIFSWGDEEEEEDEKNIVEDPFWVDKKSKEIPIKDSDSINDWEVKYNFVKKNKDE